MSLRTPRAVAVLLLLLVALSLLAAPLPCVHAHDADADADDTCGLCVQLHSPVLVPLPPAAAVPVPMRVGRLLVAAVEREQPVPVAVHAARGPPRRGCA
jgi:hypothetical protein